MKNEKCFGHGNRTRKVKFSNVFEKFSQINVFHSAMCWSVSQTVCQLAMCWSMQLYYELNSSKLLCVEALACQGEVKVPVGRS